MLLKKNFTKLLKNNKISILFIGKLDLQNGSDRIFINTFSKFLNNLDNCVSKVSEDIPEQINFDIVIVKKNFPLSELKKLDKKNREYLIGIINPTDKKNGLKIMQKADFAITGSVEEKAYYSKYIKCFIYPLIEEVKRTLIKSYSSRPKNIICYHGNKQHLDFININLEKALKRLTKEGFKFKAIYNFKNLGKCKKSFITDHIQWEKETWLEEISNSTVGVCPNTHNSGFFRNQLTKLVARKRIFSNDYFLQYKNTSNASRAFIFHQLKIPVVAEIGGSFQHILGDERAGYICYSENSWYESISRISNDKNLIKNFSERAYDLMNNLYDPLIWCERFISELKYWVSNKI
tara:strand:- start:1071 stop:2117 length:1047 start_codon:yes stop_codon:yes gene_type:complete